MQDAPAPDLAAAAEKVRQAKARMMHPAEAYRRWQRDPSGRNFQTVVETIDYSIEHAPNRSDRRHRQRLKERFLKEARRRTGQTVA